MRALLLGVFTALIVAPAAHAASVAYVDNGSVWVSSLDGAQKVKLTGPVINPEGHEEKWLDVAQSDNGRIVAVRNRPGYQSSLSWFKIWEPDGTSTVEGPLNAATGFTSYTYPLGFDITGDGKVLVYGYLNNVGSSYPTGTYVRSATSSSLPPVALPNLLDPSTFGGRVIGHFKGVNEVVVQKTSSTTFDDAFAPFVAMDLAGFEMNEADISADGQRMALEMERWEGSKHVEGKVGVLAIQGVDQAPTLPAAVQCWMPVTGVGQDPSLSADGQRLVWTDDAGLKIAGTPATAADPCELTSPPVLLSPTGQEGSIGGSNVSAFAPPVPAPAPGGTTPVPGTAGPGGSSGAAPIITLPRRVKLSALAASAGLPIKVKVSGPGKVTVTATVPAKTLGRKGKPIVVAAGSTTAKKAGTVIVKLKLTKAGKAKRKRLKGAKLSVKVKQGTRTTTKSLRLV